MKICPLKNLTSNLLLLHLHHPTTTTTTTTTTTWCFITLSRISMVWNVIRQAAHIPVPNPLRWYPFPQHLRRPPGAGGILGGCEGFKLQTKMIDSDQSLSINLWSMLDSNSWASWNDFSFISCPVPPNVLGEHFLVLPFWWSWQNQFKIQQYLYASCPIRC